MRQLDLVTKVILECALKGLYEEGRHIAYGAFYTATCEDEMEYVWFDAVHEMLTDLVIHH